MNLEFSPPSPSAEYLTNFVGLGEWGEGEREELGGLVGDISNGGRAKYTKKIYTIYDNLV